MVLRLSWVCGVALLCAGCNKDNKPGNSVAAPDASPTNAAAAVPPPRAATPAPVPVAVNTSDPAAALSVLTQALRKYSFEKRRVPGSLDEVVSAGYLKALPPAPPGKKFSIDAKRMEVVLMNQ